MINRGQWQRMARSSRKTTVLPCGGYINVQVTSHREIESHRENRGLVVEAELQFCLRIKLGALFLISRQRCVQSWTNRKGDWKRLKHMKQQLRNYTLNTDEELPISIYKN